LACYWRSAINEFNTPFLATMAFPALFPHATGDPTNPARERPVSITDGFKHLKAENYIPTSKLHLHEK